MMRRSRALQPDDRFVPCCGNPAVHCSPVSRKGWWESLLFHGWDVGRRDGASEEFVDFAARRYHLITTGLEVSIHTESDLASMVSGSPSHALGSIQEPRELFRSQCSVGFPKRKRKRDVGAQSPNTLWQSELFSLLNIHIQFHQIRSASDLLSRTCCSR